MIGKWCRYRFPEKACLAQRLEHYFGIIRDMYFLDLMSQKQLPTAENHSLFVRAFFYGKTYQTVR
jgi:hypothetical protein